MLLQYSYIYYMCFPQMHFASVIYVPIVHEHLILFAAAFNTQTKLTHFFKVSFIPKKYIWILY